MDFQEVSIKQQPVDENTVTQLMSFYGAGLVYRGSGLNYLDSSREKHQQRKIHRILAAPHPEQFSVGFSSCSDSPYILEIQGLLRFQSAPEPWGCFRGVPVSPPAATRK